MLSSHWPRCCSRFTFPCFPFSEFLDLPLLVVIYLGVMRRNPVSGLLMGAAVGPGAGFVSQTPLGMYGIVNTLVGYFAASIA